MDQITEIQLQVLYTQKIRNCGMSLIYICRWGSTNPGDILHNSRYILERKIHFLSNGFDVLHILLPFATLIRLRWVQMLLVVLGIAQIYQGVTAAQNFQNYGVVNFQTFRLISTKVERVNCDNEDCEPADIESFTLLREGCDIESLNQSLITALSPSSFMWTTSLPARTRMDGYKLIRKQHKIGAKVKQFQLQAYDTDLDKWITVGSSGFRRVREGIRFLHTDCDSNDNETTVDHRAPWPLIFCTSWDLIESGMFQIGLAVCGRFVNAQKHQYFYVTILLALGLNMAITMVATGTVIMVAMKVTAMDIMADTMEVPVMAPVQV